MSDLYIFSPAISDYEFTHFSFNGIHSSQYGLTAVVSGLSEESLAPFEDKLVDVQGRDGAYYFGTRHKARELTIVCAFDSLTSAQYRSVVQWLNPKITGKLIFDEKPYKYYIAKLSEAPRYSFVPFEEVIVNGKQHLLKGEIILRFTAPDPFAYGDELYLADIGIWNGTDFTTNKPYNDTNLPGWFAESGLLLSTESAYNPDGTQTLHSTLSGTSFYNCGTKELYPKITLIISKANFDAGGGNMIIENTTAGNDSQISIGSPTLINGTDAGPWTFIFEPSKGLATVTTGDAGNTYYNVARNAGAIHTGTFLYLDPYTNTLSCNKTFTDFTMEYKHKYL